MFIISFMFSEDGSQWDLSTFTGPTTFFSSSSSPGSNTLLRQKSSSTSVLCVSSSTLPRNIKYGIDIPDTLNELSSPAMYNDENRKKRMTVKQRKSVGATSHWRIQ